MNKAKLQRYVGLAFAVLILGGFIGTGEKRNPQLAPLDHTVIGYLTTDKENLRNKFDGIGRYLVCTMENTGKRSCAREIGWPWLDYVHSLPAIKKQYSNFADMPLIDNDDFETRAAQEIYFYGFYLQEVELPALKTRILIAHALLFLCFLFALYKREAIGRFICNSIALLWASFQRLPRAILGAAKGIHERI